MNYFEKYLEVYRSALLGLEVTGADGTPLEIDAGFERLCEISKVIKDSDRKQYLVGNGASAAFANHMALDWTKNGLVPTLSFSDSALLTAMGNDLGFNDAFSAPLSWYAKSGDLLVTISSSGNSENIIKTIEMARSKEMGVVTISGLRPDNSIRQMGDLNFYVPAKTYGIVECAHQVLLHIWLDKYTGVSEWNCREFQNMRDYPAIRMKNK